MCILMERKRESIAIDKIYNEMSDFLVIGLTGRTGSGCSTVARILTEPKLDLPEPSQSHFVGNEQRKYRIIKKYVEKNKVPFKWLQIRTIITSYILKLNFHSFCKLFSDTSGMERGQVTNLLEDFKIEYESAHNKITDFFAMSETNTIEIDAKKITGYDIFFEWLPNFSDKFRDFLNELKGGSYTSLYQKVGDNIRASGEADNSKFDENKIFSFPALINMIIKSARFSTKKDSKPCHIVVDAIRNPYEAVYLRDRYSGFYLMSVNTENRNRLEHLTESKKFTSAQIKQLDEKEYPDNLNGYNKYISQNIQKCIEIADIHIHNPRKNKYGHAELRAQLAWFTALMLHPGLVMPTLTESCMQIAYSVKQNSGCISRQVGAVVTDNNLSVKAVGWNNTPKGQVPCLLRSADDLINGFDSEAYSFYERNDAKFRSTIIEKYNEIRRLEHLEGRNLSYCFKDIQNQVDQKKNQVHTRSLHAEENAFLQISKYGGQAIQNGILFTTASPCELCAKKAYQLKISKIVYIDPYPGISVPHILDNGENKPTLELFRGAIGRAFYQLYQPFMPYKDELEVLLDIQKPINRKDITINKLKLENDDLKSEVDSLRAEIERLTSSSESNSKNEDSHLF